jgi:dephospho-CoA kinase
MEGYDMASKNSIIGLTGGMCSGKNTFGDVLVRECEPFLGAGRVVSSSDAAREYIVKEVLGEPTRDLTRNVATILRRNKSPTYLIDWALNSFESHESLRVISGVYTLPERKYIQSIGGIVVALHADDEIRSARMASRARAGEEVANEFKRLDTEDMRASLTDQQTAAVMGSADIHLWDPGDNGDVQTSYQCVIQTVLQNFLDTGVTL